MSFFFAFNCCENYSLYVNILRSTARHWEKERAGVKLNSWLEIGSDGYVLLTPYLPKGITGYDDDDDDDDVNILNILKGFIIFSIT